MLDSSGDGARRVPLRTDHAHHARRHRPHRAPDLLALQPHPGDASGPAPHRCRRAAARVCRSPSSSTSASCRRSSRPAPSSGSSRSSSSSSRSSAVPSNGSAASARSAWLVSPGEQRTAERVASAVSVASARLATQKTGALIVIARETGLDEFAETGVRARRRALGRPALHDLLPPQPAPRRRGDRPGRPDRGRRRHAPARGDDRAAGADRDAPPGGARHHRTDGRGRRRRLRGDRSRQPRRACAGSSGTSTSASSPARSSRSCVPGGGRGAGILTEGARSVAAVPGRLQAIPRLPGSRTSDARVTRAAAPRRAATSRPPAQAPAAGRHEGRRRVRRPELAV